ncbi:TetR/AcrR family transcriptional regulator [Gammaproteobacteria bacterium]|nr:TetR/AcrR family transcriptional regulator [Gammaproteobacteria bacterium]
MTLTIIALKDAPRPPKKHRVNTIVESARKVFCASGFEKGSIENIAKVAGIAEGTIYRYFESKRSLLEEVVRRHYDLFFDDIQKSLASIESPSNRLRYLIHRTLLLILEDRGMCRLRTLYRLLENNELPSLTRNQNLRMADMMAHEIKSGMKDGSFRSDTSPSIVCYMIGGALELTEFSYVQTGTAIDADETTESIWQTIHGGINSKDATEESLARLVERLTQVTDRLDPA